MLGGGEKCLNFFRYAKHSNRCILLVVERFEALLGGANSGTLLYSLFDLMTKTKDYHLMIVGAASNPDIFSSLNKRVVSRLELRTFHIQMPTLQDLNAIIKANFRVHPAEMIGAAAKVAGGTPIRPHLPAEGAASSIGTPSRPLFSPAPTPSIDRYNRQYQASPATSNAPSRQGGLLGGAQSSEDLEKQLLASVSPLEWEQQLTALLDLYAADWERHFVQGASMSYFLRAAAADTRKFFSGRASGVQVYLKADCLQANQSEQRFTETDCVLLIAAHKLWLVGRGRGEGPRTYAHLLDEIKRNLQTKTVVSTDHVGGGLWTSIYS